MYNPESPTMRLVVSMFVRNHSISSLLCSKSRLVREDPA